MKLQDFLKVKKVKFVGASDLHLTNGKHYTLLGVTDRSCIVSDNNECEAWSYMNDFEPALESAENPLQNIELTPEFEAVELRFKVGDKVYKYGEADVKTVLEVFENGYMCISNYPHRVNHETLCHATPENHAMLSKPYPHIDFEAPAKELKGSDLCRAIKAKGKQFIICAVSDISEEDAINSYLNGDKEMDVIFEIDDELDHPFVAVWGNLYKFAVPLSEETGEPLTEAVLDE